MISKIQTSKEAAFSVVGISVRTLNLNNQAQNDLGSLWGHFIGGNLRAKITDRLSDDLYSVYFEYETDHMGLYTALLGCKVDPNAPVPTGFKKIDIPESEYLIYSLFGEIPKIVGEAWREIWEFDIDRKYTYDYDRYINDEETNSPKVKIYVAI